MRRLPRECADNCNQNVCPRCGRIHLHPDSGSCIEREAYEEARHIEKEAREIRKEIRREEKREERREKCRCPYCGHDFVWPPEPCPRCGRVHEPRRPMVSPNACEDDGRESPVRPKAEGGFSKLFGDGGGLFDGGGSMMNILLMMMLFGGGMGGISEIKNLFMSPMFQLLEKMGDSKGGGNILDALGPMLGADMGALGSILANLGKDAAAEEL